MSAYLKVQRNIYPPDVWHWQVIFNNGHMWCCSKKSFKSAWMCWLDALINGLPQLKKADKL